MSTVKSENFMNFFIEEVRSEIDVLKACTKATGLRLESETQLHADSVGYVQIVDYDEGFRMGICISWHPECGFQRSQEEVAPSLAKDLRLKVLFDVADSAQPSKEKWILVLPDGQLRSAEVEELENGVALKQA